MSLLKSKYYLKLKYLSFLNLYLKNGKSKLFKKKFIHMYYFILSKNNFKRIPLMYIFNFFLFQKKLHTITLKTTGITYINHKRKNIQRIIFSIIKKQKRTFFFLKYLKFFFTKYYLYNFIFNLVNYNLFLENSDIASLNTIKAVNKFFLKKLINKNA